MALEDRINTNHATLAPAFRQDLLKKLIVPTAESKGVYYLKHDAKNGLADRLERDGVEFDEPDKDAFSRALYSAINKKPLKQVGYGMLNATLPREVAAELTPWEAMYTYVGIWNKKSTRYTPKKLNPLTLENQTLYQIVRELVLDGLDRIKFVHNCEHRDGKYANEMLLAPHEEEILRRFETPTVRAYQLQQAARHPVKKGQMNLF